MKLSIIIPTYNSIISIERCLESISKQSVKDVEIVVQDGGSTDGTIEALLLFRDQHPEFGVSVFQEQDGGVYDAMNKGMAHAQGEWLYFLGSDDELHDEFVFEQVFSFIERSQFDVIYGDVHVRGDAGWAPDNAIYDGRFDLRKLLRTNICHQAIFYRATFVKEYIGCFECRYVVCADWDFNLRCWARKEMGYCSRIIANFYGGGISSAELAHNVFGDEFLKNTMKYFQFSAFDPHVNAPEFQYYGEVLNLQRKENLGRYYFFALCRYTRSWFGK